MTLIPQSVVILKCIFPKIHENEVVSRLQKMKLTEFIDVELFHKVHKRKISDVRKKIYGFSERLASIILTLRADDKEPRILPQERIKLDEDSPEAILNFVEKVFKKHEKAAISLGKKIDEAIGMLRDIRKAERVFSILEGSELAMSMVARQHNIKLSQLRYEGEGEFISTCVGIVDSIIVHHLELRVKEITEKRCYVEIVELDELNSLFLVTCPKSCQEEMKPVLREHDLKVLELPSTLRLDLEENALETLREEKEKVLQKLEELEKERKEYWEQNAKELLAAQELISMDFERLSISLLFRETEYSLIFWAWVPEKKVEYIRKALNEVTEGKTILETIAFEKKHIPTYVPSRKLVEPFQGLTNSYGPPAYKEFNPSPIMVFTFPLIFGLMFADVGHGAILVIIGAIATKRRRQGYRAKGLVNYLVKGGELILFCGIFAVLFGVVFGSVFGLEDVIQPLWFSPFQEGGKVKIFAFKLDPIMAYLAFSFIIGIIHISSGLILSFITALRNHEPLEQKTFPLFSLWVYMGGISLVWRYGIDFGKWNSTLKPLPGTQILYLVFLPIILAAIQKHGIMEIIERVLSLLSNTISYARILALLMIHGVLTHLFNDFGESIGQSTGIGTELGLITGIILGCLVVIPLEGILGFVHTLRLHYVEWLSKFYHGEGREFKPFFYETKYTKVPETITAKSLTSPIPTPIIQ